MRGCHCWENKILNSKFGTTIIHDPSLCFRQIRLINFKSDELLHMVALRGHSRISDPKERIKHRLDA